MHFSKGNFSLNGAIRDAIANKEKYPFVFKTDVKSYYDSIDHGKLLSMLSIYVKDSDIIHLVRQYSQTCKKSEMAHFCHSRERGNPGK